LLEKPKPDNMNIPSKDFRKITCSECCSSNLMRDFEIAELVCMNCGNVIDDKLMDSNPEWRAFDDEQKAKRSRVGLPFTYTIHDKGLSTTIDWKDKRAIGGKLNSTQRMELYKLRKWHNRVRVSNSAEKTLAIALSDLGKIASSLNLSKNVEETASLIYRKAVKKRLVLGRSTRSIRAAAIYLSCRQFGIPRSLDEIASVTNINKRGIAKSYRMIVRELEIHVPLSTGQKYIAKFSNKLKISGKVEAFAIKIFESAKKIKLTCGKGPIGIAAASMYLASTIMNERKTQREIAEIANITEVTIRNRSKELMKKLLFTISL
jgi:transcription initiation factor TFIIB